MRSLLEPVLGAQLRFLCALLRDWPACWDRWAYFSIEKQIPGMFPSLSSNDEINIRCGGRRNGGRSRKRFVVLLFFQRRSFTVGVLLIILIKFMKKPSTAIIVMMFYSFTFRHSVRNWQFCVNLWWPLPVCLWALRCSSVAKGSLNISHLRLFLFSGDARDNAGEHPSAEGYKGYGGQGHDHRQHIYQHHRHPNKSPHHHLLCYHRFEPNTMPSQR